MGMRRWTAIVMGCTGFLVASPVAAAAAVAGQWNMDETSGATALDSSENGNDGALTNVTLKLPGSSGVPDDYAFGFNGHSSTMIIPKSASLAAGSADVKVSMDVRTTVEPGTGDFDYDLWSKGGYQVEIFPKKGHGQARCKFIGSVSKAHIQAGPDLADGQWHTISCQKAANHISVTVDGQTWTQSVTIGTLRTGINAWVGAGSNLTDYYNGELDNLRVEFG